MLQQLIDEVEVAGWTNSKSSIWVWVVAELVIPLALFYLHYKAELNNTALTNSANASIGGLDISPCSHPPTVEGQDPLSSIPAIRISFIFQHSKGWDQLITLSQSEVQTSAICMAFGGGHTGLGHQHISWLPWTKYPDMVLWQHQGPGCLHRPLISPYVCPYQHGPQTSILSLLVALTTDIH